MNLLDRFKIDRSANHAHLTEHDAVILFGNHIDIEYKPLDIVGEYATNLKIQDIYGNNYRVLYPWRKYSQIEVANSDYYKLFKKYRTRVASGNLSSTELLDVVGTARNHVKIPVIVAEAHVHISENHRADISLLKELNFPFKLGVKINKTTDGLNHIHLDTDQFAAIQGL